jgi:hypothetical protein
LSTSICWEYFINYIKIKLLYFSHWNSNGNMLSFNIFRSDNWMVSDE